MFPILFHLSVPLIVSLLHLVGLSLKPDLRNLGSVTHAVVGEVIPGSKAQENGKAAHAQEIGQY